jgi:hypothetical protein
MEDRKSQPVESSFEV